jgi:hypothetical protein
MLKKIAIYGSFNYHLECIGFICELFDNNKYLDDYYEIDIYYNTDNFGYIQYFKFLYNNLKQIYNYNQINYNINKYDIIFKLSSNDNSIKINHNNIFTILHLYDLLDDNNKCEKIITLSPLVNIEYPSNSYNYNVTPQISNINYIFPLYNTNYIPLNNLNNITNTIVYIGYFLKNYYDDDLKKFIQSLPEYKFIFITSTYNNLFYEFSNVEFINNCNIETMTECVKSCKFLIGRKIPYQQKKIFTGALSIAMSFKKPMICHTDYIEMYNLKYLNFKNNYSELIDKIKNMSNEEYNSLLLNISNDYNIINDHNKQKIRLLL